MKTPFAALLFAGTLSSAASAAPLYPEDVVADIWSLGAPIVLVQQISMPIVVNQAFAIGILSEGVTAYAEANVVSTNFATIAIGGPDGRTAYLDGAIAGLDADLETLLASALELALADSLASGLENVLFALDEWAALSELDLEEILEPSPGGGPVAPVPVPAALPLTAVAFGGLALAGWSRRRRPATAG